MRDSLPTGLWGRRVTIFATRILLPEVTQVVLVWLTRDDLVGDRLPLLLCGVAYDLGVGGAQ